MQYTAIEVVSIITAIFSGIAMVRANKAANTGAVSNVKLDEAKDKLEEVHKTTNGNLSRLEDECRFQKQGNKYLRALLVEYMKIVPKEESVRIKEEVDKKMILKSQLLETPVFNFREFSEHE